MSIFGIDIRLDAASRRMLGRLQNYPSVLEPQLEFAMEHSVALLKDNATSFADSTFQNPSGQFTGSLQTTVDSPYQAQLWSEEPYAQRLEYGFSGMTDALGRYYSNWPIAAPFGYRWATHTAEDSKKGVDEIFRVAIDYADWQLGRV